MRSDPPSPVWPTLQIFRPNSCKHLPYSMLQSSHPPVFDLLKKDEGSVHKIVLLCASKQAVAVHIVTW